MALLQPAPLTPDFYSDDNDTVPTPLAGNVPAQPYRTPAQPTKLSAAEGYDATILVAAHPRKSLWTSQVNVLRGASTRSGGQAPRGATAHSLLAIALTSALGSIGGKRLSRIKSQNGNQTARILVLTDDADFANGIRQFIAGRKIDSTFRAGKNLWHELLKKVRRHHLTIEVIAEDDPRAGLLTSWGKLAVIAQKESNFTAPLFAADAVSSQVY